MHGALHGAPWRLERRDCAEPYCACEKRGRRLEPNRSLLADCARQPLLSFRLKSDLADPSKRRRFVQASDSYALLNNVHIFT
jgi:hypothetical protein